MHPCVHSSTIHDSQDMEMPINGVENFLNRVKAQDTQMPLIRITKADVSERPAVVTLQILPEA